MARARPQLLNQLVRTRLQQLMRQHGLSQADLSRASGVAANDLSRLLTGERVYPSLDDLDALARVFRLSLADLVRPTLPTPPLRPEEVTLLAAWNALTDPAERRVLLRWLQPTTPRSPAPGTPGRARPRRRR